jgi:hypothetical protein
MSQTACQGNPQPPPEPKETAGGNSRPVTDSPPARPQWKERVPENLRDGRNHGGADGLLLNQNTTESGYAIRNAGIRLAGMLRAHPLRHHPGVRSESKTSPGMKTDPRMSSSCTGIPQCFGLLNR